MVLKLPFNLSKKNKTKKDELPLYVGQVTQILPENQKVNVSTTITRDILSGLKMQSNKYDAVDFVVDNTPDGKMALNTYLRLINQGVVIELYDKNTGRVTKDHDVELREFCATTLGGVTSAGLDGFLDQLYTSEILHGGMAVEVVVGKGASEIQAVLVVDPKTITEFDWLPDKQRYAAYQQGTSGEKRDLFEGNFFWIPHQPKPGKPDGTLQFQPSVNVLTQFYQTHQDITTVLHRIGYPKYLASINMEKLLADTPKDILADKNKRKEYFEGKIEEIKTGLSNIYRDSSFVLYDCITLQTIGGGVNGSGVDIRAALEVYDPLIVNAFQLTPVLMGRLSSGSYSLGTAEYKIAKDTMEVFRRSAKRMIENILNLWARVMGFNVYAKLTHNPIEWQVETEKYKANLLRMEKARRAEEYGYIDHETASIMALGDEANPQKEKVGLFEYLTKDIGSAEKTEEETTEEDTVEENDSKEENKDENE